MRIVILPNARHLPAHKLADAEVIFDAPEDPAALRGLKLVGIALWTNGENGEPAITFPARSYQGNGGTRYFNFLRAAEEETTANVALGPLRAAVLAAYRGGNGA